MTHNFKSQQGVSILFAVSILSVVLSIGLGISAILVKQLKTIREVSYSVAAFYAADNGIEEVLLMTIPLDIPKTQLNGAEYEVIVKDSENPNCDAVNFCITSIGSYRGTKRAIEIQY